ncbi:hypothetical protein BH09MYX1_BH09MYX1_30510 [soil metagenome]
MYREDAHEDRSLLIVADGGAIVALRREDGVVAWRHHFTVNTFLGPVRVMGPAEIAFAAGRVYMVSADRMVCFDYRSGTIVAQMALAPSAGRSTLLIEGEVVFLTTQTETVALTLDGKLSWRRAHAMHLDGHGAAMGLPGHVRPSDYVGSSG